MYENLVNASNAPSPALGQPSVAARTLSALPCPLPPLVVDLDGTLIRTDLLVESVCSLVRQEPRALFALPVWLAKGRAHLKREIAQRVQLDPALHPYRTDLLDYLRAEREKGRQIVLATASDERFANQVADHLKLFDLVLASDGITNLSGVRKRARLVGQFGEKGFDYAGNEYRDLAVWSSAGKAIVVNPSPQLMRAVARVSQSEKVFEERGANLGEYLSALRPQHWLKNLLVFVVIFAAHLFIEPVLLGRTLIVFVAFCCCASGGYLINDLCDLTADRRHPEKRLRIKKVAAGLRSGDGSCSGRCWQRPGLAAILGYARNPAAVLRADPHVFLTAQEDSAPRCAGPRCTLLAAHRWRRSSHRHLVIGLAGGFFYVPVYQLGIYKALCGTCYDAEYRRRSRYRARL